MTPVDDLNVGDHVAVVGFKGRSHCRQCGDYSGTPHQITAISLPFIALNDGNEVQSIDIRVWELKRLSIDYVAVFKGEATRQIVDPYACPRCGDRYCEKLVKRKWRWFCRTCHYDGGIANKEPNK